MGDFKPLLPWQGSTLCGAVVAKAVEAGLAPILVTGYRADALEAAFEGRTDLLLVHNPDWEAGMVGSIQAGCRAALVRWPGLPGLLVAPADMPNLPVEAFGRLASRGLSQNSSGRDPGALFAAHDGKLGHPVWIPAGFVNGILALGKGGQLKPYLMTRLWEAVEVGSDAIFLDLDTREDYLATIEKCDGQNPSPMIVG
jgi:molybdenum cofactor cytidylyltransferase